MPYPAKPHKLKVLEGNRGKKKMPADEPRPRPVAPSKPPPDLDTQAKKTWKKLAPQLERLGVLTEVDGDAFAHLCQIRSRLIAIHKQLKKKTEILVVAGKHSEAQNVLLVAEKQYYQLFRLYCHEFGLTPRARVGLSVKPDPGKDPMKDLLDG